MAYNHARVRQARQDYIDAMKDASRSDVAAPGMTRADADTAYANRAARRAQRLGVVVHNDGAVKLDGPGAAAKPSQPAKPVSAAEARAAYIGAMENASRSDFDPSKAYTPSRAVNAAPTTIRTDGETIRMDGAEMRCDYLEGCCIILD